MKKARTDIWACNGWYMSPSVPCGRCIRVETNAINYNFSGNVSRTDYVEISILRTPDAQYIAPDSKRKSSILSAGVLVRSTTLKSLLYLLLTAAILLVQYLL